MTELLFRADSYRTEAEARVVAVDPEGGIVLDATLFYAQGGGQPGDIGILILPDGSEHPLSNTVYSKDRSHILHQVADPSAFVVGETIRMKLDWATRLPRMKIHTALHLLSVVLPYPVTGGSVGEGSGRLDFDIPEADFDKEQLGEKLNALIQRNAPVAERYITEAELDANPGLVKTMSVQPPRGNGTIRLVEIAGLDLQPCGGTHVKNTGEIGPVAVTNIEKKGKLNRRIRIALV